VDKMKFFRGDKIWNNTEPGRYRFDGIRSKSFGKGKPSYVKADLLLETIRQHVNPVSSVDKLVYDSTEFISFSGSQARAIYWLSDQDTLSLQQSVAPYQETRYLFEMDIDQSELIPKDIHHTMYIFRFACDYRLKEPNSPSVIEHAMMLVTERGTYFESCPICNMKEKNHAIVLINTVAYLNKYKNTSAYDGAIINATNDQEWLVLPLDKITGFSGTTIPRADFWSARHYIGAGEVRDPMMFEIPGLFPG
jgi:hypothetical protein